MIRALLRVVFPDPPRPLTRESVLSKLESLEFLMKHSRECLRADLATRFEANVAFAIEQLKEIEERFDARG